MSAIDGQLSDLRVVVDAVGAYGVDSISGSIRRIASLLAWDNESGPFGKVIKQNGRVLVKPNFVTHANQGPWGIQPLVTQGAVVKAVVEAVLRSEASEVLVGDAPVQACDWGSLIARAELDEWAVHLGRSDPRFRGIKDFRRTISVFSSGVRRPHEHLSPTENYVLFDLSQDSLLEPISYPDGRFRVTCYHPALLAQTHAPGRHQYLIAREVLEADVLINLPKLKTHKKAGITCALKNLVGINGNKEFLPHHRMGGSAEGGDCYPGRSRIKRALENVLDRENSSRSMSTAMLWHTIALQFARIARRFDDQIGVEGSWAGNDTVWRMALDLNRIVVYGRPDGSMADTPQRMVINIVDAVVAGQGDGPLAPEPLPLGLILAGSNAAAVDWIGAEILSYEQSRVPLVREAFSGFKWPLVAFAGEHAALIPASPEAQDCLRAAKELSKRYPAGWLSVVKHGDGVVGELLQSEEA